MKNVKTILCLISLLVAGITNMWGSVNYSFNADHTTLTVYGGDGITKDYTSSPSGGWFEYKTTVTTIIINEGVTTIGEYAFKGFDAVTTISIPVSLTTFKRYAFDNCEHITTIKYAGSPNQWANIDFANQTANPFGKLTGSTPDDVKNNRGFCFYGSNTKTNTLVFEPGITTIKQYAFINAHYFTRADIPNSVSSIGNNSLKCLFSEVAVYRATALTLGGAYISFTSSGTLYVPSGATSSYATNSKYWKDTQTYNTEGYISISEQATSGTISDTYGAGIEWSLATNGTLTLNATGANKAINFSGNSAYSQYPWSNFRRLVNKVVIQGEISELSQTLTYLWGLSEITFDQTTIPEFTTDKEKIAYGSLFNTRDNVKLNIKAASLSDASASNLGLDPWNNAKLTISLSDAAVYGDEQANTLLTNIKTYVDEPFDLTVNRTLSTEYLNTFCSPVEISDISGTFGAGTYLYEFAATEVEDDTLRLNFTAASKIEAGKPYLIQPANITSLSFSDVDPSDIETEGGSVSKTHAIFYGTLVPTSTEDYTESKNFIFLLANNKLTYATEGTLKGLRAYFLLKDGYPASMLARRPVLNFDDEQTPTAIDKTQTEVKAEKVMENGVMYIIKNGVKYSVMGERVK